MSVAEESEKFYNYESWLTTTIGILLSSSSLQLLKLLFVQTIVIWLHNTQSLTYYASNFKDPK